MAFAVGDFACGCVNSQLLVLPGVRLVVVWTVRPIGKNEVSEGLDPFPIPMWDGECRSSVSRIGQQCHRLGRVHIGGL